ncbi:MAG: DegT/DnrJ/EryC1/StrS family aminotransferase [Candidatus Omnitrophica bacterium]|nr:DegT/DnrJ/EryC1/StrS family aminotransferase [Candidatus Omnitrophota bacterium]
MQLAFPRKHTVCYRGFWRDIFRGLFFNKTKKNSLVEKFEKRFAEYIGVKYAVAVSSGRWGLHLILKSLGVGTGDEVIFPAITEASMPSLTKELGARPVFIDFSTDSFNMDIDRLKDKISANTGAIISTHLFGTSCDIRSMVEISRGKNINVIEDCAHGIGVKVNAKKVGSFGKAGFFSFGSTKSINTLGGGMVTTNDYNLYSGIKEIIAAYRSPTAAEILKNILHFYIYSLYSNRFFFTIGALPLFRLLDNFNIDLVRVYKKHRKINLNNYKIRFTDMQALLGIRQLDMIEGKSNKIKELAKLLKEKINSPHIKYIKLSSAAEDVQYLFTILTENRDILKKLLLKKGIDSERKILEVCPHLYGDKGRFDNAENISRKALQLSTNACLSKQDMLYIANAINEISAKINN